VVRGPLAGNPDPPDEVLESSVGSHGIEPEVDGEIDHLVGARAISLLERMGAGNRRPAAWPVLAKFAYNLWRPVTAIRAGGGNPDLVAEPDWTPLGTTPSHPEYPAAHGCVTGVVSSLIRRYFGTPRVPIVVDSLAFSDGVHTHTLNDTRRLFEEVFRARIYAGFRYHHSLEDGGVLGRQVSRQLFRKHFRPLTEGDDEDEGNGEDRR
jgi:hypothetical protein